jgi:hypothetical protein
VKPFSKIHFAIFVALCILLLMLIGCASSTPVRTAAETANEPVILKKIAVVSFEKLTSDDGSRVAQCPVSGTVFSTCALPQNAEVIVQDFFLQRLEKSGQFVVIPPYQSDLVYQKVRGENVNAPVAQQLQKAGKLLEADGIVIGYVSCFRERVGYSFSAERPASVTFGVYLIRVSDGDLVWGRIYDKTQQSFSENVFQSSTFFRRGLRWVTAAELAEDGVDEIVNTFPGYR